MKLQWPWVPRKKYEADCASLRSKSMDAEIRLTAWKQAAADAATNGAKSAFQLAWCRGALDAIAALETPRCAHVGKKAARIAREALGR